ATRLTGSVIDPWADAGTPSEKVSASDAPPAAAHTAALRRTVMEELLTNDDFRGTDLRDGHSARRLRGPAISNLTPETPAIGPLERRRAILMDALRRSSDSDHSSEFPSLRKAPEADASG
ncbi:hypothetical protein AB0N21_41430, partial [Streptomyces sp. NPDC051080]|uniref:hypothetical protein n=1 Tax=Streptomyces sp. NPDC051080 TaxID=3157222 RepID=UPI0034159A3D